MSAQWPEDGEGFIVQAGYAGAGVAAVEVVSPVDRHSRRGRPGARLVRRAVPRRRGGWPRADRTRRLWSGRRPQRLRGIADALDDQPNGR